MQNTDKLEEFYRSGELGTLMLYPVSANFVKPYLFCVSANPYMDTEELRRVFWYYAFEQRNALISGDLVSFNRVRKSLEIIIDKQWVDKYKQLYIDGRNILVTKSNKQIHLDFIYGLNLNSNNKVDISSQLIESMLAREILVAPSFVQSWIKYFVFLSDVCLLNTPPRHIKFSEMFITSKNKYINLLTKILLTNRITVLDLARLDLINDFKSVRPNSMEVFPIDIVLRDSNNVYMFPTLKMQDNLNYAVIMQDNVIAYRQYWLNLFNDLDWVSVPVTHIDKYDSLLGVYNPKVYEISYNGFNTTAVTPKKFVEVDETSIEAEVVRNLSINDTIHLLERQTHELNLDLTIKIIDEKIKKANLEDALKLMDTFYREMHLTEVLNTLVSAGKKFNEKEKFYWAEKYDKLIYLNEMSSTIFTKFVLFDFISELVFLDYQSFIAIFDGFVPVKDEGDRIALLRKLVATMSEQQIEKFVYGTDLTECDKYQWIHIDSRNVLAEKIIKVKDADIFGELISGYINVSKKAEIQGQLRDFINNTEKLVYLEKKIYNLVNTREYVDIQKKLYEFVNTREYVDIRKILYNLDNTREYIDIKKRFYDLTKSLKEGWINDKTLRWDKLLDKKLYLQGKEFVLAEKDVFMDFISNIIHLSEIPYIASLETFIPMMANQYKDSLTMLEHIFSVKAKHDSKIIGEIIQHDKYKSYLELVGILINFYDALKSSYLSNLISVDKEHKNARLTTILNDIYKQSKDFAVSELIDALKLKPSEIFDKIYKITKNVKNAEIDEAIVSLIKDLKIELVKEILVTKQDKDATLFYKMAYLDMFRRWYFMPDDGPIWDYIILPMDYPYAILKPDGVDSHPIPNGADKATREIAVDVNIMSNVIDFCIELWEANAFLYSRYTPEQAVKHFVNLLFDWLDKYIPDNIDKIPEYYPDNYELLKNLDTYREDYWRLYRWIRWYAESIVFNVPESDKNQLLGNKYVRRVLIDDLIKYFNDHHGVYGPPGHKVFDKTKGVRHKWIDKYQNKLL